jgi:gamma-glutamylcyclotransferase (GGCT)/AIG2-like uncharacterized protein YtfP
LELQSFLQIGTFSLAVVMHLFTYGTLVFPEVWQRIAVREAAAERASLTGFAIYRVRDAVFPGIVRAEPVNAVAGVLYRDLDENTLFELDAYESDFYCRETVAVVTETGDTVECQAYVVPEKRRDLLTDEPWDAEWFAEHKLEKYLNGA